MDFIATAPADSTTTITNDGWFPAIDLCHLRAAMRLDGTVTDARLGEAVIAAVTSVNTELASWQTKQWLAGYCQLKEVPAAQVNHESVLLSHYRRAIYYVTKAELTEHYRDFDSTKSGRQQADELEPTIDTDRRTARWAIRDFLGLPHANMELI